MMEFFKDNLGSIITAGVTIIGFIVTIFITKKNINSEVNKIKAVKLVELLQELPYQILHYFDNMVSGDSNKKLDMEKHKELFSKLYAYGSAMLVKVLVLYHRKAFSNDKNNTNENEKYDIMILLSLMVSQLKYDITGEVINPINMFKAKITDYDTLHDFMPKRLNEIICENNLNTKFYFKENTNE